MSTRRSICVDRRGGQTLIFLALALVILALVVLWVFDLHKTVFVKARARNAGDAAALAAARWQGLTLNMIGELNLLQAAVLAEGLLLDEDRGEEAAALADLQARLAYVGPMMALHGAQQAAKQNRIPAHAGFARELAAHAATIRREYPRQFALRPWRNPVEPPTCWDDYARMVEAVALQGIAAAPENMRLYHDVRGAHLLLNPSFYDAVASRDWCWFHFNGMQWLTQYQGWGDWPDLPRIVEPEPANAEIFGLGLMRVPSMDRLPGVATGELLAWLRNEGGLPAVTGLVTVAAQWMAYQPARWRRWQETIPAGFPFDGSIRPEYDYAGADAVVRIETQAGGLSPGSGDRTIVWTAAAKPFGHLPGPERPDAYGLVLPAFREVRLIPIDASSAPAGGSRPGWMEHIREHLPRYLRYGPARLTAGCWYCAQIRTWDNLNREEPPTFQEEGLAWLQQHWRSCRRPGPGTGPGGGTRVGH